MTQILDFDDWKLLVYTGDVSNNLIMRLFHKCSDFQKDTTATAITVGKCIHCNEEVPKDILSTMSMGAKYGIMQGNISEESFLERISEHIMSPERYKDPFEY